MNGGAASYDADLGTEAAALFGDSQSKLAEAFARADGAGRFEETLWTKPDGAEGGDGGGGRSLLLRGGRVFEQAGINFSDVTGTLPGDMAERLTGRPGPVRYRATGVSLVVHPWSPHLPTTHANCRYLTVGDLRWFGGGADLTPYYLYEEDARHFHAAAKAACDEVDPRYYPEFKRACDEYFYLPHRGEGRGVGGVFFDYLGRESGEDLAAGRRLAASLASGFDGWYLPMVERRAGLPWTDAERRFQTVRRGRYVEFNLLYDRGTLFGLKTGGRIESIFMSLPPEVRYDPTFAPEPGSREAELEAVLRRPKEWV